MIYYIFVYLFIYLFIYLFTYSLPKIRHYFSLLFNTSLHIEEYQHLKPTSSKWTLAILMGVFRDFPQLFPLTSLIVLRLPLNISSQYHTHFHLIFYVLLTVHLGTIFVNKQLEAQFFFMYVYFFSLHVSGSHVPIIRRINYINTTYGICHSCGWPSSVQVWISLKPAH